MCIVKMPDKQFFESLLLLKAGLAHILAHKGPQTKKSAPIILNVGASFSENHRC